MTEKFKLDTELKQRWVTALRSGKYKQGRNCLKDIDSNYCCLGVLADLINSEAWASEPRLNGTFHWNPENSHSVFTAKYLVTDPIPAEVQRILAKKNDCDKLSFLEIADYIETNL